MQGYEGSRPQNFITVPPDCNTKTEQPPQPIREPAGFRVKQQPIQSTFTQEAESLGIRSRNTACEHQQTSWAQLQQRGSEEKVVQTIVGTTAGPTSPRSTANQTPSSQINLRESSTANQMPAGLVSGGSIFPHTQHKGRRKIGQPFLHTQYNSQAPSSSGQTQASTSGFLQFQKSQGGIFAQGASQVATTNATNHRVFSKPHQRNLTSSKEEFKLFHMLPTQTPSHLTQLQPQLQTSQNQQHTSTANSSGIDGLCDTSTSASNTRISSFKTPTTTANMTLNYQQTQHMVPHVTTNTADSLLAASIDDQFKLIAKGTGSSKFPAAVAFEIAIAKPSVVQNQLRTPGQHKLFQRSSKLNQNNTNPATTAIKVTQSAAPQQIQQLNQIKSSGLQVLGMPPNPRGAPFNTQQPSLIPNNQTQSDVCSQLTAQKSSQFVLDQNSLTTVLRNVAAPNDKLPVEESQQLSHNPLFPNHIGYSAAHQQHTDMTPSAHKRKTLIKVPVVTNSKIVNSLPQQNLEQLEEQHREQASQKRATSKKPLILPVKAQHSTNQQVVSMMHSVNDQFQDLFQIQLIKPQDRTNANSVMQRKLARTKQQKNTNTNGQVTQSTQFQQFTKSSDQQPVTNQKQLPTNTTSQTMPDQQNRNVEKEFVELEQEIKTKESRQHKQLKIIQRQSRAIRMRSDDEGQAGGYQLNLLKSDVKNENDLEFADPILNNSIAGSSNFSRCSSKQADQIEQDLDAALHHQQSSQHDLNTSKNKSNSNPLNLPDSILQSKSSDSSFTRNFNLLLEQSEGLKWQYNEIIRHQLSTSNEVYSNFVKKIIEQNRSVFQDKKYHRTMPLNQRKREELIIQNSFTFERVVYHIEQAKLISAGSEKNFRIVHSDQSGQLLKSNSVRQSHASILSPNFSLGAAIEQAKAQRQRDRRSMLFQNQKSKSHKLIIHQNSGQLFQMPDLWNRTGNSLNLTRSGIGISDNNSQLAKAGLVQLNIQHSSSGKTPTPQHQTTKASRSDENQPKTLQQLYGFQQKSVQQQQQVQKRSQLERLFAEQRLENNFLDNKPATGIQIQGKIIQWVQGKIIGQGITGEVYEAMNINTAEMFVVKKIQLVHPFQGLDQTKVKALKHEIDRFKLLDYQHIVTYYGGEITENNIFCIYLEYMSGGSIADLCKRYGRLGETICRQYTIQVLKALVYLHSKDVIHGDLKGANVLLTKDGERIKLCDLGNSRLLEQEQSWQSIKTVINGTLAWMAPECSESKTGKKSDVWSLGCLVVEMLSGENPWGKRLEDGNIILSLQRALQQKERPEPPKFVSEECRRFVDRCLQHSYKERPYAHELLEDPWIVGDVQKPPVL